MGGNSIGKNFTLTSFGESHGIAIGGFVDGCLPNVYIDVDFINNELARRRPGQSSIVTQRDEQDRVEILSGTFEGYSTGTPIAFLIRNLDHVSKDYESLKGVYRPSHADFTYEKRYGIRDYRGGGRSSARETAVRVAGGAIAKLMLKEVNVDIVAYVQQIGNIVLKKSYKEIDTGAIEKSIVRCPDEVVSDEMINLIKSLKAEGDTTGGIVFCNIQGVQAGLGEPVFDKLHADLAKAMLSINAVKGFEYGSGFTGVSDRGSDQNDRFIYDSQSGEIKMQTNFSGGIQGGISNGEDIYFNVAFKPVATLGKQIHTINSNGKDVIIDNTGRHDVCVVPRAVPVVEAMAALVIADHYLRYKSIKKNVDN